MLEKLLGNKSFLIDKLIGGISNPEVTGLEGKCETLLIEKEGEVIITFVKTEITKSGIRITEIGNSKKL